MGLEIETPLNLSCQINLTHSWTECPKDSTGISSPRFSLLFSWLLPRCLPGVLLHPLKDMMYLCKCLTIQSNRSSRVSVSLRYIEIACSTYARIGSFMRASALDSAVDYRHHELYMHTKRSLHMYRILLVAFMVAILCLPFFGRINDANAQTVMLPIQNIPQETQVWCWAAVAQQIVYSMKGPTGTPPQCYMVALANGALPAVCCNQFGRYNGNPACMKTGSLQQIQWLIGYFGGQYSVLAPPANPKMLFDTLQQGRAIILVIQSSPFSSHVVVLRGMSIINGMPVLHINDPLAFFTQPVPFPQLMGYWASAIVVGF